MSRSPDIEASSAAELRVLVVELLSRVGDLSAIVIELRAENARLKGLKGRPDIKPPSAPSGMDKASRFPGDGGPKRRGGGLKTAKRVIHEDRVIAPSQLVPPGSRFKGTADVVVQDLVLRAHVIRYRRECWLTPSGETIIAPFPGTIHGHFGPELRRYVLMQYHQGQVRVPRLLDQLRAFGIDISKRQLVRLLIAGQDDFLDEAQEVLRTGRATAGWISVDDTKARHKGRNGVCTQSGNSFLTKERQEAVVHLPHCRVSAEANHSALAANPLTRSKPVQVADNFQQPVSNVSVPDCHNVPDQVYALI